MGGFLHPVLWPRDVTLDIDGLPGKSAATKIGSSYNEHVKASTYSPLIISLAEIGDMVGDVLLQGIAAQSEDVDTWDPH